MSSTEDVAARLVIKLERVNALRHQRGLPAFRMAEVADIAWNAPGMEHWAERKAAHPDPDIGYPELFLDSVIASLEQAARSTARRTPTAVPLCPARGPAGEQCVFTNREQHAVLTGDEPFEHHSDHWATPVDGEVNGQRGWVDFTAGGKVWVSGYLHGVIRRDAASAGSTP